jgi:hypothetical protein
VLRGVAKQSPGAIGFQSDRISGELKHPGKWEYIAER